MTPGFFSLSKSDPLQALTCGTMNPEFRHLDETVTLDN
jgi:hypothetical protein